MKLIKSYFVTSAQNIKQCPPQLLSEIVFLGRSNVGKSTFINLLCNQKNLAKSSQTPGKTQLINFFLTEWKFDDSNEIIKLHFVDLPGFGYAKVSKEKKELWNKNLVEFLQKRDNIRLFVHLVDSRHPNLDIDNNLVKFISQFLRGDQRLIRIFTKFDKLNSSDKSKLRQQFQDSKFSSSLDNKNISDIREFLIKQVLGILS